MKKMIEALRRMVVAHARALIVAGAAFALYLLFGFLAAPALVERGIRDYVTETLKRKASIGEVRVNPLLLRLEIGDFALAEPDGAPIVAFKRLAVDFELSSLARWAWTFSEIGVDGLDLRADIRPDGSLNLAALAASLPKRDGAEPEAGGPPRLVLQHAALRDSSVTFSDRSGTTPASATAGLDLELRDISTLPERRGPYTVSARLRSGGTLRWRGEVSLQPVASLGEVEAKGVKPVVAWRFLRDRLNVAEPAGTVDFSGRYRFAYKEGAPQLIVEDLRYTATGIELRESGASGPLLVLDKIEMTGGRFDLAAHELVLPRIEVRKGFVVAEADSRGVFNWQRLAKPSPAARSGPTPAPESAPWKIRVEALNVGGIALRYGDRGRAAPSQVAVGALDAGLAAAVEAGRDRVQVVVSGLALKLSQVTLGEIGGREPLASLDAVALEGGSLDLEQRRIAIQRVAVSGGSVRIVRSKNGTLRIVDALTAVDERGRQREIAPVARAALEKREDWRGTLDAFEVGNVRVLLADEGFEPALGYELVNVRAAVRNISNDGRTPFKFDASLRVAQGGAARASGSVGGFGEQVAASVKVERVALKPLQPLVARHAALRLESGELSVDTRIEYRAGAARPQLRVTGGAAIDNLLLNESNGGERLLAWNSLAASGVALSLAPDRLAVEEVRLLQPGAKIVIFKDRSVNLAKVLSGGAGTGDGRDAAASSAPPQPAEAAAAPAPPFDVRVERVRVENGVVDFSDLSLVLPFTAKVEEFNGAATDISSDAAGAAALRLEGKVGEFGLARVNGTLKPFKPKSHLDIGVIFRNVELVPLSPYSVTFAGRRIATGRVSLDLQYKIENSQLAGDNKVVLDKFTLGESVESPGALKLPYDLAIALLTDSDGRINVAVPVKGNVDDPQFSYGHLIWQAIATVITNIVTAPFRALASLFGGGAENLENIAFEAGRATLAPPEREKLKRVAEALGKRPQLVLVAEGQFDDADRAALRQRDVALAIAGRLGRKPAPGGLPEPVNPLDARTQRAMEALFVERTSDAALSKFVAEVEKARAKPVQRVNPVLALAGRASADAAFYQAMLKQLEDTARIPDEAPGQLASARARAVTGYMTETLSVPSARVAAKTAAEPGGERVKLSFDVAREPSRSGGRDSMVISGR
jgi:uncharacterized protein involved in outer membrane biogenesis